ncbi:hypothetical protein C2845_PM10G09560 [Panicum miliaceum]|uniref:Uncharacterized protein n=1 Tax=Panicum miliaceum TaxID=4540 RepID=A0A3L6PB23_PANMI|nr:hypothetical protein C2845_PM10G09560 [Panicum miliaceum]
MLRLPAPALGTGNCVGGARGVEPRAIESRWLWPPESTRPDTNRANGHHHEPPRVEPNPFHCSSPSAVRRSADAHEQRRHRASAMKSGRPQRPPERIRRRHHHQRNVGRVEERRRDGRKLNERTGSAGWFH